MLMADLIFLACLAAAVVTLIVSAVRRSMAGLRRLAICAAISFAVVILVSLVSPRRVIRAGIPQCFDDFCIAFESASPSAAGNNTVWQVNLRLSSRARRISQRENNLHVFITDREGHE